MSIDLDPEPIGYEVHNTGSRFIAHLVVVHKDRGEEESWIQIADGATAKACHRRARIAYDQEREKWEARRGFAPERVIVKWSPPYRPDPEAFSGSHEFRCPLPPLGWWCSRGSGHDGPCAARPCWWNVPARIRFRGMR